MADAVPCKRIPTEKSRGGQWIEFGDEAYRIPPLGFLAIQELGEEIKTLDGIRGMPTAVQMNTIVDIVHAAIKRNYPSLPREEVVEMLDIGNFSRALGQVLQIAGFTDEKGGAESGEALTGAPPTPP